jgi:hypothetical protein
VRKVSGNSGLLRKVIVRGDEYDTMRISNEKGEGRVGTWMSLIEK